LKSPETNSQWLSDVQGAYDTVKYQFENGILEIEVIEDLYKSAAQVAANNRGISDPEILNEMYSFSTEPVEHDISLNPAEREKYKFQFVIAYIHSHVPAGFITEMEGDRIMDYVNEKWDLFGEA
jgi:hypothetical protein